jgi:hypothetical protein
MESYLVRPEVAGELGPDVEIDANAHPPRIDRMHYVFFGWAGSDIVESFPIFIVTNRLAEAFRKAALSGFEIDEVKTSIDEQFESFFPESAASMPSWNWLRVTGDKATADFWQDEKAQLHVSDRAKRVLESFNLVECEIVEDQ